MELNREHFRANIYNNFRRRLIKDQYSKFNRGRSSLQLGRPKSVVVAETIDAVRQLVLKDYHVTYCEIETTLAISRTSIHSLLHEHFTVKKICSHWIPHNLWINRSKKSINQCDKSASTIGSNACKSV